MKRLLLALVLAIPLLALAQPPYQRNSLNTNVLSTNLVWFPATLRLRASGPTPSIELWNTSGTANFRRFIFNNATDQLRVEWSNDAGSSSLLLSTWSSDGNFAPVSLSLSGATNRLSIVNNTLLLDGVAISGSTESAPSTNFYAITINVTTQNFTVGKGGSLTITNNVLFPYTTLTFSGTNVSQMNLTNTAFALTLSTNAFIGTPTGFPGTGRMGTFMLHVVQDGSGSKTLTLTNGSFIVNGSGTSTNAVLTLNTNANAYSLVTLTSSPFEAGKVMAVVTTLGQ